MNCHVTESGGGEMESGGGEIELGGGGLKEEESGHEEGH